MSNFDGDSTATGSEGTSSTTDAGGTSENVTTEATASTDGENSLDSLSSEFGSTLTLEEKSTTSAPSASTTITTITVVELPSDTVTVEPVPQVAVVCNPAGTAADITDGTLEATPRG